MSDRRSSSEVDDEAARWAARVDARALSDEEARALDTWLDADPRHLGAFAKARAIAVGLQRAQALGPGLQASQPVRPRHDRRRVVFGLASAAAALVGIVVGIARYYSSRSYSTGVGETRVVPLDDGSVVTLNTHSKITVRYTAEQRTVDLERGEGYFDVAKDRKRPFIVNAGGTQVRAVGTSFTVSALPKQPVKVLVREGVVEIKRPDVPTAPVVRAAANVRAVAPAAAPIVAENVTPSAVTRELAWRVGRIAFEGDTLNQAAAEFSRYSNVRIVIDEPAVGEMTITGLYVSNDPVGFAKAVSESLNLRAKVSDEEVHLTRR